MFQPFLHLIQQGQKSLSEVPDWLTSWENIVHCILLSRYIHASQNTHILRGDFAHKKNKLWLVIDPADKLALHQTLTEFSQPSAVVLID